MQRSHCENENVQFVQELAEVDGPFESPININFRDLTKLELPPLVWNRAEVSPKKMKITNTGHTGSPTTVSFVIISGKWKCERPYLTGGPLSGKYVFSQIHFHWGQDDCRGSEHQVCGEGFPLEMHVAHFKTEYLTQECALREKDGMVVVVYLFKLQDEPNASLKKILNLLPCVKQASTSHAVDPKPILSLCNPFTEDYFMYWGSVVTSTCAHILLWIISREPFGISREQVNEFRKILDTSHQPICRNSRDTQPLHRRNVFHVNASKHLNDALLPVKKVLGCYCRGSEDNVSSKSATNDCNCQAFMQNQEDVEGNIVEHAKRHHFSDTGGKQAMYWKASLPSGCFAKQSIFVQTATIHSIPMLVKKFDSEPVRNLCCLDDLKQTKSEGDTQLNSVSKSCCFLSTKEVGKIKSRAEKRKVREKKKPFNSARAFSQLMDSLEAIKNQTFKKLKEIESINQEIKGMKPFCHDSEDKKWLRKIEKIISRQKRFTLKSSQGCFSELKKLARECNFDKFFDGKALQVGDHNQKVMWLNDNEVENGALPYSYNYMKGEEIPKVEMTSSKPFNFSKAMKFSAKAQKLIQSFFEDIKESDDLQETVKKDLEIKKTESFCSKQAGDSNSVSTVNKGYITQKMFTLGNLGDRFFTEVSTDDFGMGQNEWPEKRHSVEMLAARQDSRLEKLTANWETKQTAKNDDEFIVKENINLTSSAKTREAVPFHRNNVSMEVAEASTEAVEGVGEEQFAGTEGKANKADPCDSESPTRRIWSSDDNLCQSYSVRESKRQALKAVTKVVCDLTGEKLLKGLQTKVMGSNLRCSSSDLSTESTETHCRVINRIRKRPSKKDLWEEKRSALFTKISSKELYEKNYKKQKLKNVNFEGYCIKKKLKKKRSLRRTDKTSWDLTSTSKEETKASISKSRWKRLPKARFRLEIKKFSESALDSAIESCLISPERKKLKLEQKKKKAIKNNKYKIQSNETCSEETEREALMSQSDKYNENENIMTNTENSLVKETKSRESKSTESQRKTAPEVFSQKSENDFGLTSRASRKKKSRASSVDSRTSYVGKQESKILQGGEYPPQEPMKKDFQVLAGSKVATRNRSLNSITTASIHSTEMNHRVFVETIDDRRLNSELRKRKESPKKIEEKSKLVIIKDLFGETSNETDKKFNEDRQQTDTKRSYGSPEKTNIQTLGRAEYNTVFFTTPNQMDKELLSKTYLQEGEGKAAPVKRCDANKYHFLETGLREGKEDFLELPVQTDSNKSSVKVASKDDMDLLFPSSKNSPTVDNKELQASISYSTLKKNSSSRHHSAETLISHAKTTKRKYKKHSHCRKRSSKHHMRKNSSVLRKPNKVESKQLHLLNLTDEEQIKIISANVAKYLKQKLVEQNTELIAEKKCSFKEIKEAACNNLVASQEKLEDTTEDTQDRCATEETENSKANAAPVLKVKGKTGKAEKKQENRQKSLVTKPINEPKKEKPASTSPKPVHNFIKRNKQMAGKYKRMSPSTEKNVELKKKEEEKSKQEREKVKFKPQYKRKDKGSLQKQDDQAKSTSEGTSSQQNPKIEKPKKGSRIKSPRSPKKPDSKSEKTRKKPEVPEPELLVPEALEPQPLESEPLKPQPLEPEPPEPESPGPELEPTPAEETEQPNQLVQREKSVLKEPLPPPIVLRKIPQPKKRLMPAYMLTSYLPAPIEIVQSQKRKMNKYLLGMDDANLDNYLPEVLQEAKNRKTDRSRSDPIFEKELEYLIKLQMCLNEEITTNIENSMNYVKTLFSPDYPPPYFDSGNSKGVILLEMKDLDFSSSGSDLSEDISKHYLRQWEGPEGKNDSNEKNKEMFCTKMPKESGDSGTISPLLLQEAQENSDSSYDCKISITLNPNAKESEREMRSYDTLTYLGENSNSQTTIYLEGSSSQSTVTKSHRKKRKENEISLEMKQKLLEILEGEIKREIGMMGGVPSEISSDGLTIKWEDSDGNNRSQSTESSCDNMEMLTQISETMKQYLSDFKERRREEIISESSDKESRDDE